MVVEGDREVLNILEKTGAVLSGHFVLSSGLHSDSYIQCAKLLQFPEYAEAVGRKIADLFNGRVNVVTGAALGAVILIHEVARALGVRGVFFERENGEFRLRRGFEIKEGERVLIVEDVVTTGGSVVEVVDRVREYGGVIVGVGSVVKRGDRKVDFGVPFKYLVNVETSEWEAKNCPMCKRGIPAVKPGSRKLNLDGF